MRKRFIPLLMVTAFCSCMITGCKDGDNKQEAKTVVTDSVNTESIGGTESAARAYAPVARYATVKVNSLNIRAEKTTDSNIVIVLEKDDRVRIVSDADSTWTQIEYNDSIGYVMAQFLTLDKTETTIPKEDSLIASKRKDFAISCSSLDSATVDSLWRKMLLALIFTQDTTQLWFGSKDADTLLTMAAKEGLDSVVLSQLTRTYNKMKFQSNGPSSMKLCIWCAGSFLAGIIIACFVIYTVKKIRRKRKEMHKKDGQKYVLEAKDVTDIEKNDWLMQELIVKDKE